MASERRGTDEANEYRIDTTVADSFPASDPPSYSGITGAGKPYAAPSRSPSSERGKNERPTGSPTSDRHATETAYQWEDQAEPHKAVQSEHGSGQRARRQTDQRT